MLIEEELASAREAELSLFVLDSACFVGEPAGLANGPDGLSAVGIGLSSIMYVPLDVLRLLLSAALPSEIATNTTAIACPSDKVCAWS